MTPEERAERVMTETDLGNGLHGKTHTCKAIVAAIREAVAAERERCAKIADEVAAEADAAVCQTSKYPRRIAERIRKGGNP